MAVQSETNKVNTQVLRDFTKYLKSKGWLKINTDKATSLINHHYPKRLHKDTLIDDLFSKYLNSNRIEVNDDTYSCAYKYAWRSLDIICDIQFHPNKSLLITDPLTDQQYLNSYRKYAPVLDNAHKDPLLFLEYLERLFPVVDERKVCTQWLAHILQRPQERPSWHLMLSSQQGTGKGFLIESIMNRLLMHQTMVLRKYSQLLGQFSSCLSNSLLILLDDTKATSQNTTTELKSILSEERQYIEIKQKQGEMMACYSRIILASNEIRPILLDEDDRRWYVVQRINHFVDQGESALFVKKLEDYFDEYGLDEVYWYLMNVDLSDFNHKHVAKTETHKKMTELSVSVEEQAIQTYCSDHSVFSVKELKAYLDHDDIKLNANLMKKYLTEAGYLSTRGWHCGNGKANSTTYYHLPTIKDHETATRIYGEEAIARSGAEQVFKHSDCMHPENLF